MKTVAFVAALMLGTAALAQATPPADGTTATTPMPDATTPPAGTPNDGMATPPAPAPAPAPMAQPAPTEPPSGTMATDSSMGAMNTAMATPGSYPRCSASVTDQCRQNSARESDTRGGPAAHHRKRRG